MTSTEKSTSPEAIAFFKEFNAIDWRTYHTLSALSAFECFWRNTEKLVEADADRHEREHGPKWNAETDEEVCELFSEIRAVRCSHDEVMMPMFRYAAVVTLCSIYEKELTRAAGYAATQHNRPLGDNNRGLTMKGARKILREKSGIDLTTLDGAASISDLQKIRNCLVHCGGDAEHSRDRVHLESLSSPERGLSIDAGIAMEIQPRFIERSLAEMRAFFGALFKTMNWTVNDCWKAEQK